MKKQLFLLLLLIGFTGKLVADENTNVVKVGDTMPSFTITPDEGNALKSKTLKGKVVLISFFATWCPPCQTELASIEEKLWPVYKDNPDFKLLVIGREHSDRELNEYNEKKGFTFPLYPDKNRTIYDKFAKSYIPRTYLIGKDGKIKAAVVGHTSEGFDKLMKEIEQELKK